MNNMVGSNLFNSWMFYECKKVLKIKWKLPEFDDFYEMVCHIRAVEEDDWDFPRNSYEQYDAELLCILIILHFEKILNVEIKDEDAERILNFKHLSDYMKNRIGFNSDFNFGYLDFLSEYTELKKIYYLSGNVELDDKFCYKKFNKSMQEMTNISYLKEHKIAFICDNYFANNNHQKAAEKCSNFINSKIMKQKCTIDGLTNELEDKAFDLMFIKYEF